ncbi:hypothetical protein BKA70DRAFT_1246077 [Coprinopsis sp. MPI-PUGE-AT-0042]|nr:hypothetical protein BKA70DRAFT_1246077 [Coprinopsis sp. MPI-PUGE-AT-0042]
MSQSFPNEILGSIISAGVDDTTGYDKPTVKFLKDAALISPFLRHRAQELLLRNLTLNTDSLDSSAEKLVSALQINSSLLLYPRCLTIRIGAFDIDEPEAERFPATSAIGSLCGMLEHLDTFILRSTRLIGWSLLSRKLQDAIVGCAQSNALKYFDVTAIDMPSEFIQLLPSISHISLRRSGHDHYATFARNHLANSSSALSVAARPSSLKLDADSLSWLETPDDSVFKRVCFLDYRIWEPQRFLNLLPRVSGTLKDLTIRYHGFSVLGLPSDHFILTDHPPESRFCRVPGLECLHFEVAYSGQCEDAVCPSAIPQLIVAYCTPAFSSLQVLYLHATWIISLPKATAAMPEIKHLAIQRFLPDSMGLLDDVLSEMRYLKSLQKLVVDLEPSVPVRCPDGQIVKLAEELKHALRDQLRQEALECFSKTAERMELHVITSRAFWYLEGF